MSFSEWKDAVKSNKIPSGAIIFMTRNKDWSGNQSSGHDASIAKQGGKRLWSGLEQAQVDGVGAVYGNASQNIIALTPGGQQIPYDGSTSGDTGEEGESGSSDQFEALTSGLLNMISAAGTMFDGIQGISTDKASYDNSKTNWESIVKTGNQTTATGATPPKTTVVAAASGGTPGSSAIVAVPVGSTGGTPTALARDTTSGGTPAQLTPVRNI